MLSFAVAVLAVAVWVFLNPPGATGATPASPQAARAPAPTVEAAPAPEPVEAPPGTRAVFVGDSWTAGFGINPEAGYAPLAAAALGWDATYEAVSGTGYLNPGPGGEGTYADRVRATEPDPTVQLVVLQGGLNDRPENLMGLGAAVRDTLDAIGVTYPNARTIILGPAPSEVPASNVLLTIDNTLAAVAQERGVHHISPLGEQWITAENYADVIDPGNANHPSVEGHAYLAGRTVAALEAIAVR
ncbi:hypothetical protein N866_13585 [Actinotalea ferrariae CF5-4]|uniref:SGNH hydrolase-type esterase domain-containing protein n=1 Tax=Actinotalea ferrariae CF5-4 TaxID=948458 RepID=A0A021VSW8_9CELL|nr:hypothetical protein N866_13585 [Actinotalea ferrariae CF5-4]